MSSSKAANIQEISPEGRIVVQGFLPRYNLEGADQSFVFWLQTFVQHFNEAEECYAKLMDDDRLIGQERFVLIGQLDTALNHMIALRRLVDKGAERFSIVELYHDFELHIRILESQNRWTGQGQLGRRHRLQTKNLRIWFSETRKKRLTAIVRAVGAALQDGIVTNSEQGHLARALDRVIFSFLLLRERISAGDIS